MAEILESAGEAAGREDFERAFAQLSELVDLSEADALFPRSGQAVYTASVVLWMLIYQRMKPDASLEAAVKHLLEAQPQLLPDSKRIREGKLSASTGGYSRARNKLPTAGAEWLCEQVSRSLIEATEASWEGRRVYVLDGTTITLAPEPRLRRQYPPSSSGGDQVWPVALLVMAHELASGAALRPQIGPMFGPAAVSETALALGCIEQLPPDGIVLADANFGIFAIAWATRQLGRQLVSRLTAQRFHSLRKQATLTASGENWKSYAHVWRPTAKDRADHSDWPADAALSVQLHEIAISPELTLYLVSDLPQGALALADLYQRRGDIEIDIRNFKVVLNAENIRARTPEMFHKELLLSVVSYNLVTQFRRQAAKLAGQPPRRMSFKRTWTTFHTFLLARMQTTAAEWRQQFERALRIAATDKLPNRPNRSYPRETYRKRPKSTHFLKRKPKPDNGK